jgi:predicted CxxxxCH...CXXCH cytochrome family protein
MDRWTSRAVLAVAIAGLAGCGGQSPSTRQEAGAQKGQYGVSYFVNVSRPVGGTITSGADGKIDCGAVGTHDLCGPAPYAWGDTAVLSARADDGQYFQSWAGDCSGAVETGGCRLDTLTYGADKWVVAVFNPPDQLGHSRIPDPAQHAPLYRAFIKSLATPDPGVAQCTRCHGQDYNGVANAPSCTACHAAAGKPNWLADCSFCHGNAPSTGAHQAHFGLTGTAASSAYGDLSVLQDRYPGATPTSAPSTYAFGCGNCHPATDAGKHMDGVTQVSLFEAGVPAASLKARNAATAAFDPTARTCSGVYCHSSGNDGSPIYVTTPSWLSTAKLACNGCHANPPRYASGGAGTATANSHLQFSADAASPWGHYAFVMTERRYTQHGRGNAPDFLNWSRTVYSDAAPITCQTCHFGTTDPSSTGPSGFYWLDTTGDYALLPNAWNYTYVCTSCHSAASTTAPLGQGRVLPLRHVNGARDVQFDARTGDPGASWVPSADRPVRPYWFTQGSTTSAWWINTNRTMVGTTAQFDLSPARYDPLQKTCTNVTCHMAQGNMGYTGTDPSTRFELLRWGAPYYVSTNDPATGRTTCSACHRGM